MDESVGAMVDEMAGEMAGEMVGRKGVVKGCNERIV